MNFEDHLPFSRRSLSTKGITVSLMQTPQNRRRTKSLDHGAATVSEGHVELEPPIGWKGNS